MKCAKTSGASLENGISCLGNYAFTQKVSGRPGSGEIGVLTIGTPANSRDIRIDDMKRDFGATPCRDCPVLKAR